MKQENIKYPMSILILVTTLCIIINLLLFLIPAIVNKIINLKLAFTNQIIIFIIAAMVLQIGLQLGLILVQNKCMKNYKIKLCVNLYQKIFSMRYEKIIASGPTYLVQRADAAALTFSQVNIRVFPILIAKSLIILIILLYSFTVNIILFFIMLGITIANILGFYFLNKKLGEKSVYMQNNIPKEREDIYQIAGQVDFLKQNGDNSKINPILNRHLQKIEKINMEVNTYASGGSSVINFFNIFLQNLVLITLTYLFLTGKNDADDLFTIMVLMAYFVPAIMEIVSVNLDMRELRAGKEFIMFLNESREKDGELPIGQIDKIEIDAKQIGINRDSCLLKNVKLEAQTGDVIGIIGESGTGKSTLAKNMLKYWQSSGIKINGIPLEKLSNESYRSRISYYSQNPLIVTGTMDENLNFGKDQVREGTYEKLSFLEKFQDENGRWNKEILENGNNLSGGDKQKISLARMLVDTSDVIILDEPTSSLDTFTENMILDSFFQNCSNKIVFIITHRTDNLKYCNKIYKIENSNFFMVKE